jgi:hypothetical protein
MQGGYMKGRCRGKGQKYICVCKVVYVLTIQREFSYYTSKRRSNVCLIRKPKTI